MYFIIFLCVVLVVASTLFIAISNSFQIRTSSNGTNVTIGNIVNNYVINNLVDDDGENDSESEAEKDGNDTKRARVGETSFNVVVESFIRGPNVTIGG